MHLNVPKEWGALIVPARQLSTRHYVLRVEEEWD